MFARIRCNVITVGDIDTVTQQFTAEVYLSVTWKEPKVKGLKREVRKNNLQFKQDENWNIIRKLN